MTNSRVQRTKHATKRQAQRGVRRAALLATLDYGREIPAGNGDIFLFLGRAEARHARRAGVELFEHTGTTLILLGNGSIKTMWRAPRPPRDLKRRKGARRSRSSR